MWSVQQIAWSWDSTQYCWLWWFWRKHKGVLWKAYIITATANKTNQNRLLLFSFHKTRTTLKNTDALQCFEVINSVIKYKSWKKNIYVKCVSLQCVAYGQREERKDCSRWTALSSQIKPNPVHCTVGFVAVLKFNSLFTIGTICYLSYFLLNPSSKEFHLLCHCELYSLGFGLLHFRKLLYILSNN